MKNYLYRLCMGIMAASATLFANQASDTDAWYILGTVESRIFAAVVFAIVISIAGYRRLRRINEALQEAQQSEAQS